jgi:hypothetical protein
MPGVTNPWSQRQWRRGIGSVLLLFILTGCSSEKRTVYQDYKGFSFTPPSGWVERVRDDALPARSTHKQGNVPLPPLGTAGNLAPERIVARYDRVTSGSLAWLRVTLAELTSSVSLKKYAAAKTPGSGWKWEADVEELELDGMPAARIAFAGRWNDQDYLCETVVVRRGDQVYVISGSFPAADHAAREQVRQAVASAGWQ